MLSNQEKQKVLQSYYFLDQQIERKLTERKEWYNRASKMVSGCAPIPQIKTSAFQMKVAVDQIGLLEEEISQQMKRLIMLKEKIEEAIHSVSDDTLQLLLEYRYLDYMTWEMIADKMNYDIRWIFRLHKKALSQLIV